MSFKIRQLTQIDLVAEERLFLTADGKEVVGAGDKRAATLLAAQGQIIPAGVVKRLGLKATEPSPEVKERTTRVLKAQTRD